MPLVRFLNTQSWAGGASEVFCYAPGQIIDLDEAIAVAREKAGLGKVVKSKAKSQSEDPKPEDPKPEEPKPEEPKPEEPKPEDPKKLEDEAHALKFAKADKAFDA